MLLLATVGWGCGFTWAKSAQDGVNRQLGLPLEAAMGPVLVLGVRYTLAGIALLVLVGRARRGWSVATVRRSLVLGVLLGGAVGVQHLGLGRTSEAVSAFLTSLVVLFVPLLMTIAFRRPPARAFWLAALLATAGIWLMTGATPTGFGLGEALGLACAFVFSFYVIAIDTLVPRDDPWRLVCGQFLVVGVLMLLVAWWLGGEPLVSTPRAVYELLGHREIWADFLLLWLFSTLLPFTVMNVYQPRVDPTRATLIYLVEPIVAAAYAYATRGGALGWLEIVGMSLVLGANGFAELQSGRRRSG